MIKAQQAQAAHGGGGMGGMGGGMGGMFWQIKIKYIHFNSYFTLQYNFS